ncbi:MAG: hypothetical protein KC912_12910 [Proteobacteria bacterium]|nr:hypothetical protein [Pseudomonadota bacterium]
MADKRMIAAGAVAVVVLGGLACVGVGGGGFWYYKHQESVGELMPTGEATVGTRPAAEMPSLIPSALINPGSDTSLPWPVPGITSAQCDDLTDGGDVRADGCITAEIHCDETIVGHTRGGIDAFNTKFYEKGFCTPGTTQHDGGDERVYLFKSPPGKHRIYFTLDTPCGDLDVSAMRYQGDGCPTEAGTLGDCEMLRKDGTERERISVPTMDEWKYLVVVEGEGDAEGAFALTAQCGPWR